MCEWETAKLAFLIAVFLAPMLISAWIVLNKFDANGKVGRDKKGRFTKRKF